MYPPSFRSYNHYFKPKPIYARGIRSFSYKPSYNDHKGPALDRISWGLIKRSEKEVDTPQQFGEYNPPLWDIYSYEQLVNLVDKLENLETKINKKRDFDSIGRGLIRNKRSIDNALSGTVDDLDSKLEMREVDTPLVNLDEEKQDGDEKRGFDRLSSNFVKKNSDNTEIESDKRGFDRLSSSFIKKRFDRLSSGFVKKDSQNNMYKSLPVMEYKDGADKRKFDRMSSGFIKKSQSENDKRGIDRLGSGFVKKGTDINIEDRSFDRMSSGFIKKSESDNKRGFDRMSSGFVKKDLETSAGKRGFDRMSSGFVKKSYDSDEALVDAYQKRYFDRMSSGFIKKSNKLEDNDDGDFQKRYFDRLSSGFVKKDSAVDGEKRGFDRLTTGFIKKSADLNNEANIDYKPNNDEEVPYEDKRYFDRLANGLVKKKTQFMKGVDRLGSGFIQKSSTDQMDDFMNKRYFDRINSGLVRRDEPNDVSDDLPYIMRARRSPWGDGGKLDRIGYGLIKRGLAHSAFQHEGVPGFSFINVD